MKKSEFKLMVREIVREEVKLELKSILKESKKRKAKPITKTVSQKKRLVKKPSQQYTDNPVLNDILNETANAEEWKTLGGKTFTSGDMGSILAKQYENQTPASIPASLGVSNEALPEHLNDALTKDYSGLMKAIDKKKNGISG